MLGAGGWPTVSKGPQVQLVQSLVVHIGADGIDEAKVFEVAGLAEVFLLVQNVVLGASNDTSILNALYSLGNSNAREDWVRAEAFPVTSALGVSTDGADDRTELDIYTFTAMFDTHLVTPTVKLAAIPRGGNSTSSRECGYVVGEPYTKRAVLGTEAGEAQTRDGSGVAHTLQISWGSIILFCSSSHIPGLAFPSNTGGQVDLLEESQLTHKSLSFCDSLSPARCRTVYPGARVEGRAGIIGGSARICAIGATWSGVLCCLH